MHVLFFIIIQSLIHIGLQIHTRLVIALEIFVSVDKASCESAFIYPHYKLLSLILQTLYLLLFCLSVL